MLYSLSGYARLTLCKASPQQPKSAWFHSSVSAMMDLFSCIFSSQKASWYGLPPFCVALDVSQGSSLTPSLAMTVSFWYFRLCLCSPNYISANCEGSCGSGRPPLEMGLLLVSYSWKCNSDPDYTNKLYKQQQNFYWRKTTKSPLKCSIWFNKTTITVMFSFCR